MLLWGKGTILKEARGGASNEVRNVWFRVVDESQRVTIQMLATEQYFPVVLFIMLDTSVQNV